MCVRVRWEREGRFVVRKSEKPVKMSWETQFALLYPHPATASCLSSSLPLGLGFPPQFGLQRSKGGVLGDVAISIILGKELE